MLGTLHWAAAAMVGPAGPAARRSVPLPALRLGGEWAGHTVGYSSTTGKALRPGTQALTWEQWNDAKAMERRCVVFDENGALATQGVLPLAQSGSELLTLSARMLEPEVLNIRAWALDASGEDGVWQCETIIDGLCGNRPAVRADALECPKERTRVQFSFNPTTGTFPPASPVHVWHERCWQVSPSDEKQLGARESGDVDSDWLASVVGFECFDGATAGDADGSSADESGGTSAVSLDCGIELSGKPGLLELTLISGEGARNGYNEVCVRRSWVGTCDEDGCSVFTEVEVKDDTTGDK